eukprot:53168-Eustigmatos_ZCMA.PRE.1
MYRYLITAVDAADSLPVPDACPPSSHLRFVPSFSIISHRLICTAPLKTVDAADSLPVPED